MLAAKPIPRVLSRHNLVMGCEREPLLVSALVCGGVGVSSMTLVAAVVCATLWGGSLALLRWMAKADPQMLMVYRRTLNYRDHYPAHSRPGRAR